MTESLNEDFLSAAVDAIRARRKPIKLMSQLSLEYENAERDISREILSEILWNWLAETPAHSDAMQHIGVMLRALDAIGSIEEWVEGTTNNTQARRQLIYKKLGFPENIVARMELEHRFAKIPTPVLISEEHEVWYSAKRKYAPQSIYWRQLEQILREQWNDDDNLSLLDRASDEIVSRLSDPLRNEAHSVKGLVVGYVQSGKTANFTSVIAKSIDAGYRLVIVLAGQWDILREQTQRRLDKELCGKENIVRQAIGDVHDYVDDEEWESFVSHGGNPSELGGSDIVRLTTSTLDYKSLGQGINALEFVGVKFPERRFNISDNLYSSPTKLIVIKKNKNTLTRLIKDLKRLANTELGMVPALIIDDESDQASVNTKKPTKSEQRDRTAINQCIVEMLKILPRSQYVGYTATPFANVFVDPEDAMDIYPRHFIYALERPIAHYMGVRDFFDVDEEGIIQEEEDLPAGYGSNSRAYIRTFKEGENDEEKLAEAVKLFVLTGAIKLLRQDLGEIKARHHTMLVHRSHKIGDHDDDKILVEQIWRNQSFGTEFAHNNLEALYNNEILPVSAEKSSHLPLPASYDQLRPYIASCIRKIESQEVRVINGSKSHMEDAPAFESESVWSILVGGTKLSRGYTVEGLTISYFMRRSKQVDTLMQMGRWFGFRKGYRDLVRVYLQTGSTTKPRDMDLVAAFRAACMDEEALRAKLEIYKDEDIKPIDVAPVVQSHMLMPTSKNKMFNTRMRNANLGGKWKFTTRSDPKFRKNNTVLLRQTLDTHSLTQDEIVVKVPDVETAITMNCFWLHLSTSEMKELLRAYQWPIGYRGFDESLLYLNGTGDWDPAIDQWLIIFPQVNDQRPEVVLTDGTKLKTVGRTILEDKRFDAVTEPKHRKAAEILNSVKPDNWKGDISKHIETRSKEKLNHTKLGVALAYLVIEKSEIKLISKPADKDVTVSLSLLFPKNNIKRQVAFSVIDQNQAEELIVDVE
jgi:hypothetical protein